MTTKAIRSQGVVLKRGDGGGPEVFTAVGEITGFDGPSGSATVIDATHLASTAREKLMGLPDEGQFSFNLNLDPSDAQQIGLKDDRAADPPVLRNFELVLTDAAPTKLSFSAFVTEFSISGAQDDKVAASVTLEISGPVTWS